MINLLNVLGEGISKLFDVAIDNLNEYLKLPIDKKTNEVENIALNLKLVSAVFIKKWYSRLDR